MTKKSFLHWSSGKDSALALYYAQKNTGVNSLLTTIDEAYQRVSMHGIPKQLLEKQVASLNMDLKLVELKSDMSLSAYNRQMQDVYADMKASGYEQVIFGDILLEDLKAYRETELEKVGLKAHFPLWGKDTKAIMQEFIALGFKAIVVAVNASVLDKSWVGREIDASFLADLPSDIDPAGENGEYHTFVYDGPIFQKPVDFKISDIVSKSFGKHQDSEENCFKEEKEQAWATDFYFADLD